MEPVIVVDGKKKASAKKTVAKKAAKTSTAAKLVSSPSNKDGAPPRMKKPAQVDDLKKISGVGPKIEKILHSLGIYKYEQVAKWKKSEREWVDGYLKFKGRIEREDWVSQAKTLAKKK